MLSPDFVFLFIPIVLAHLCQLLLVKFICECLTVYVAVFVTLFVLCLAFHVCIEVLTLSSYLCHEVLRGWSL